LNAQGYQSSKVLLRGQSTGQVNLRATLVEPGYEGV
jgi:hypothetical protein